MTFGSRRTSSGVPSAICSPWSSTVMRSLMPMTTRMSCSMSRMVSPSSWRRRAMSASARRLVGFMPAVGSSSSSSSGRAPGRARSRGGAGRRRAGSSPARRPRPRRPTRRAARAPAAAAAASSRPLPRRGRASVIDQVGLAAARCIPTSTFSSAVMFWKSRMFWNVRPMPAATTSFGRALRKMPSRREAALVPERPDDREQQGHDEPEGARSTSADDPVRLARSRRATDRSPARR